MASSQAFILFLVAATSIMIMSCLPKANANELPSYIFIKNDAGEYMHIHEERGNRTWHTWLQFGPWGKGSRAVYKVIPLNDGSDQVLIQSVASGMFWRNIQNSVNWIWADVTGLQTAQSRKDCHFKPMIKGSDKVVIQDGMSGCYLRMYTADYWQKSLNAASGGIEGAYLTFEHAATHKTVNVRYDTASSQVSGKQTVVLGTATIANKDPRHKASITTEVAITRTQTRTHSVTTSSSLTFGESVTVTGGVPEVASVSTTVTLQGSTGKDETVGEEVSTEVQFPTSYMTVNNVSYGDTVVVTVECDTAQYMVPITYDLNSVRYDGVNLDDINGLHGYLRGVTVYNVKGVISYI